MPRLPVRWWGEGQVTRVIHVKPITGTRSHTPQFAHNCEGARVLSAHPKMATTGQGRALSPQPQNCLHGDTWQQDIEPKQTTTLDYLRFACTSTDNTHTHTHTRHGFRRKQKSAIQSRRCTWYARARSRPVYAMRSRDTQQKEAPSSSAN